MAVTSFKGADSVLGDRAVRSLTSIQRYMLRRFHPQAVLLDTVAGIWLVYFLWHHQWPAALVAVVVSRLLGTALARNMDYATFARGTWGRLALLHLHPTNVTIQMASAIVALFGVWTHSTVTILIGLSAMFLGHLFGWKKVLEGI